MPQQNVKSCQMFRMFKIRELTCERKTRIDMCYCPSAVFQVNLLHIAMLANRSSAELRAFQKAGFDFNSKATLKSGECFGIQQLTAFDLATTNPQSIYYEDDGQLQLSQTLIELGSDPKAGSLLLASIASHLTNSGSNSFYFLRNRWNKGDFTPQQLDSAQSLYERVKDQLDINERSAMSNWFEKV